MKNVKIYKLTNAITDDVFVGSTLQPLYKRLYTLKVDASCGKASPICDLMRRVGKDKFMIELLEEFPHSSPEHTRYMEKLHAQKFGIGPSGSGESEALDRLREELDTVMTNLQNLEKKFYDLSSPPPGN